MLLGVKFGREAALWPALALAVTLVAAAATDLEQRIIPNRLMAAGAVLALVLWTLADPEPAAGEPDRRRGRGRASC